MATLGMQPERTGPRLVHNHNDSGMRVRAKSGIQYQWCAGCGALGASHGGETVWVMPGVHAEDSIVELVRAIR